MRHGKLMAGVAALAFAGVAGAQGYGPGMMGGGYGGYGPGMMGGGYGSGVRDGAPGWQCGPGMMGWGGGGGPGMMGWGGGGPGMMGWGGHGTMGYGYGMQGALDLSDDQRKKVDAIHDDLRTKTWDITGKMRAEMSKMREAMFAEPRDKAALDASYKRLNELRQQRFDAQLAARDQMDAVFTQEQRQSLKRRGPWWMDDGE